MAYGTVIYAEWFAIPQMGTKFRLELEKLDYSGSPRLVNLRGNYMDHNYQTLNLREPFKNTILKSDLTMLLSMEEAQDTTLLEEVFGASPRTYRIVKYVNDEFEWMGFVDTQQIEYPRSPGPILGNLLSRDLDELSGQNYALQDGRARIIKVIAEILATLGYALPIRTYTRWKEGDMTDDQDILHELYIDRFALRTYGRGGAEPDESITQWEALEHVLKAFKLFLIQSEGYWNLFQLTSLENASAITEHLYDVNGDPEPEET